MQAVVRGLAGLSLPVSLAILIAVLSIDSRALWTDEIGTWELTLPGTFASWVFGFLNHYNSDGQIPLYHAYMWVWVQCFGSDEWVLRAANVPWLVIALAGCARLTENTKERAWILLSFSSSAFIWYYVNDARPYILFVAGACWVLAGTLALTRSEDGDTNRAGRGVRWLLFGAVVLIGGSVLGAFWLASLVVALGLFWPAALARGWVAARLEWRAVLLAVLVGGVLLAVAVNSHIAGARANQTAAFSLAGMAYGLIELLGAAGLGPSRNDLRVQLQSVNPLQLVAMGLLALLSAWSVFWSLLHIRSARARLAVLTAVLLPLLLMVVLGLLLQWRVVGRHLSALFPLLVLAQAQFLQRSFGKEAGALWRVGGLLLVVGLVASSVSMRWLPRHEKDDYQAAAIWSRDALAKGLRVVWLADERGLAYYGLAKPGSNYRDTVPVGLIPFSRFASASDPTAWPEVIVFSPREGVDPGQKVRPMLRSGRYQIVDRAAAFELHVLKNLLANTEDLNRTQNKATTQ